MYKVNGCTAENNCWTDKEIEETPAGLKIDKATEKPLGTCGWVHAGYIAEVDVASIQDILPQELSQNAAVPNRLIRNQAQYDAATKG